MLNIIRRRFGLTAYTWGDANLNAHANPSSGTKSIQPIESLRGRIAKIAFSPSHAAAITTDGKLYTWGEKKFGKLGLPGTLPDIVREPTEVTFFSKNGIKVKDMVVAKNHTIVLDTEGRAYSFGKGCFSNFFLAKMMYSQFVALGHPTAENVSKPKLIEKLAGVKVAQISTGKHFSLAATDDDRLMVWGRGEFGVLGCGNRQTAEPIENEIIRKICETESTKIKKIQSCQDFSSVLFTDGSLYSFGNNDEGVMGLGRSIGADMCEVINTPTPLEFRDDKEERVADFELGEFTSVILGSSGKVYHLGQRLYLSPNLVDMDYSNKKVRSIAAFAKGVGVVTEDNQIFTKGSFWPIEDQVDEDINTGVSKVNFENTFGGKKIVQIGNRWDRGCYVLVDEDSPAATPNTATQNQESPAESKEGASGSTA